jgi:hypothetical protein
MNGGSSTIGGGGEMTAGCLGTAARTRSKNTTSPAVWCEEQCSSHVTRHTTHITRHTSHVTRHTSHITRHTSRVTRHTSHVTRHTSHVTLHTSQVTRPKSHVICLASHVTRRTAQVYFHQRRRPAAHWHSHAGAFAAQRLWILLLPKVNRAPNKTPNPLHFIPVITAAALRGRWRLSSGMLTAAGWWLECNTRSATLTLRAGGGIFWMTRPGSSKCRFARGSGLFAQAYLFQQ